MDPYAAGGTSIPAAYDAYLRGLELYWRFWSNSPGNLGKAIPYFEQAIALDPNYGAAYAGLAAVYHQSFGGYESALGLSPTEVYSRRSEALRKALEHPTAQALQIYAQIPKSPNWIDDAIVGYEHAIELDSSQASSYSGMAYWLIAAGRIGDAQHYLNELQRLYPRFEDEHYCGDLVGWIHFTKGEFEAAAAAVGKYVSLYPNDAYAQMLLVAIDGYLGARRMPTGTTKRANEYFTAGGERAPFSILSTGLEFPMKNRTDMERFREGLRKAGVPELPLGFDATSTNRLTGDETKALIFGQTIRGCYTDTGMYYERVTAKDGVTTLTNGTTLQPDGIYLKNLYDNEFCFWYPTAGGTCWTVFRNPSGTREKQNEYFVVYQSGSIEFSVIK